MTRASGIAAAVTALALASAAATCRGPDGDRASSGDRAVPAEVEIDWPDAAVMPPPARGGGDAAAPDAGP